MTTELSPEPAGSKLSKLKNRLERGIRQPSMDHLRRKPSAFFRSQGHRRQRSLDERSLEAPPSPGLVARLSPARLTRSRSRSTTSSINISPDIELVSNFSSPARSINSQDVHSLRLKRSHDMSPSRRSQLESPSMTPSIKFISPVPRIDVCDHDGTTSEADSQFTAVEPSKLAKFKRKMSIFFDQDLQVPDSETAVSPRQRSLSTDGENHNATRPPLNKALSDSKKDTMGPESAEALTIIHEKDLMRKRSRTLGSVENDLYHRRNGSIVKAIGSMVMMNKRQPETPTSVSDSSEMNSDLQPPHTPPPVEENDTPESYVLRLLDDGFESEMTLILSDDNSEFLNRCLYTFMTQTFDFTDQPLDIALRRFLMTYELPKEAQQIDRVLECFSRRFYDCNEKYWDNKDQIYFLTFSLVMLHTDHFNGNNKRKMTKEEFVKNTRVDNPELNTSNTFLTRELFEYLYDNITSTRFIQKTQRQQSSSSSQPIYLLPKRMFSSTSSTNLEVMSSMRQTHRSQSISSSTSQFFMNQSTADPYFYILTDQLSQLRLNVDSMPSETPFQNKLRHAFPETYFTTVRNAVTDRKGIFLRFNKDSNWVQGRTEIVQRDEDPQGWDSDDDNDSTSEEDCLLRVIKCDVLYKEETVSNNKFFTIGSSSRVIWKRCYGMLTMCGFFIFDNLNFMTAGQRTRLMNESPLEEPLFIDVLSETALKTCQKLSINGLFACQSSSMDNHHTFNIFSTNKRVLFSTPSFSAMSSWIFAINYIASLDSCHIDYPKYVNNEMVPIRTISVEDKVSKLLGNLPQTRRKIDELIRLDHHLQIVTPLLNKTRELLLSHHQSLKIRLDWLWYEVERNQSYITILRNEIAQMRKEGRYSMRIEEEDSFLEDSFINDVQGEFGKMQILGSPLKDSIKEEDESEEYGVGDLTVVTEGDEGEDEGEDEEECDDEKEKHDEDSDVDETEYFDAENYV